MADSHGNAIQSTLTGESTLTTDETIYSAHVGTNAELFPKVLALHVERGSCVADVTYGTGTFWNHIPSDAFDVVASDLNEEKSPCGESIDCRDLPYDDGEFDAVVLDPPYAAGLLRQTSRAGEGSHESFRDAYTSEEAIADGGKYHGAVRSLYRRSGEEAARVLRDGGKLIAKMQDEVVANSQELTHIQVTNDYRKIGLSAKDLFVLIRSNNPASPGVENQEHARKKHSYFMVCENDE